jgi:lipopolysaccharide biosynthesis glycosyltransferase
MHFVFGLDAGFVMPTGVAMRSLDRFLSDHDRIVLLHLGLDSGHKDSLSACASNARVDFVDCAGQLRESWVPPAHVSPAAFVRYLAPQSLPDVDRCVYLDGDVIVRHDPTDLHDVDLEGNSLGAVRSRVTPYAASPGGIAGWFDLGIPSTAPYFNSGILTMDLARWRDRDITGRLTSYLDAFGERTTLADQEALNAAVVGDWAQLDRTWNYVTHVTESFLQQPELEPAEPAIVHFAGRSKPWLPGRLPIFADEWFHVAQSTPWSDFRPSEPMAPSGSRARARAVARRVFRAARALAVDDQR